MKTVFKILITFLTSLLLTGCDFFSDTEISEPNKVIVTANGIQYTFSISTNTYSIEDTLQIVFLARNISVRGRELRFNNMPELCYQLQSKFDNFSIYYPNIVLPAGITHFLRPGATKSFNAISLFKDHNGVLLEKGDYVLTAFLGNSNSPKLKLFISLY
ncbi:MAG TPA: hypothetical protein VLH59_00455 [Ignavibacteriaceae bacterium]|nr:hypothetical protein [Ignavibacteriaceae bacterium]